MKTDAYIKHEFIVQTIQWGLDKLRKVQTEQLHKMQEPIEQAGFDYKALLQGVSSRGDGIVGSGGVYQIVVPTVKHLRYADMKYLRTRGGDKRPGANAAVYNRPMWGVFSGSGDSVRSRLRSGISEALHDQIMSNLEDCFRSYTKSHRL